MSIANYAVGLTSTVSAFLIPIARFRCRRADPRDTANLAQTLDQLLKKNQQLLERNGHLMGEMASLRNNPLNSIPATQVQILDDLTDKNQHLQKKNQKLVGEVAAVRSKLVGPVTNRCFAGTASFGVASYPAKVVDGEIVVALR